MLVEADNVLSAEWFVASQFWDFLLRDQTLQSWRTDSPARTLVRLAYKSFQMGLPFSLSSLSIVDGELFSSHKKKVEEMQENWEAYPFSEYSLKAKTKKSYVFKRVRADCPCGRRANLMCISLKCCKCCKSESIDCLVHSNKK